MNYALAEAPELDLNDRLRMEKGWGEVGEGLSKVLFGYAVLIAGVTLGVGMILISVNGLAETGVQKAAKPSNFSLWMFYLGGGILSVIGVITYSIIVGGQFKCMMGAAERNGARWFMFMCIACIFFGPAFEFASGVSNWETMRELRKNPHAMSEIKLNPMGQWLHLIGFCISMLYPLCFLLFLRAVAVCLHADAHVMVINVFIALALVMVAATGFLLYLHPPGGKPIPPPQALMVAGGWGVLLLLYIGIIFVMRGCIYTTIGQVRSPLDR